MAEMCLHCGVPLNETFRQVGDSEMHYKLNCPQCGKTRYVPLDSGVFDMNTWTIDREQIPTEPVNVQEFANRVCEFVFARFMDRTPMKDWEQRELLDLYIDAERILALDCGL